jgi:hypothetical protein
MSAVPQGSVLGPLLFHVYGNDVWRNLELTVGIFAEDCIMYRKIMSDSEIENYG